MVNIRASLKIYVVLVWCTLAPLVAQSANGAGSVVPGVVKFAGAVNDTTSKPLTGSAGVTFLLAAAHHPAVRLAKQQNRRLDAVKR